MSTALPIAPLTAQAFAPFGDVLEIKSTPDEIINAGNCERFDDLAKLDFEQGRAAISLFSAQTFSLPFQLDLVERHPLGSQAFIPMYPTQFLIVVAEDDQGQPKNLCAFLSHPFQGINYHRNVWHAPFTPLEGCGLFAVIDRIAPSGDQRSNLQLHHFNQPVIISQST